MTRFLPILAAAALALPAAAQQSTLIDQQPNLSGAVVCDTWLFDDSAADDFVVADPAGFLLEEITFYGAYYISGVPSTDAQISIRLRMDNCGRVYVNGELKQDFEWGREKPVVLVESARPGDKVVIAIRGDSAYRGGDCSRTQRRKNHAWDRTIR